MAMDLGKSGYHSRGTKYNTIDFRYIAMQYNTALHTKLLLPVYNFSQYEAVRVMDFVHI